MSLPFVVPDPDDQMTLLLRHVLAARQALHALDVALVEVKDPDAVERVLAGMAGLGRDGGDTSLPALVAQSGNPARPAAPEVVDVRTARVFVDELRTRLADAKTLEEELRGRPTDRP